MWIADKWRDYELCDASDGERLERWNGYVLRRPDPQVIWKNEKSSPLWKKADAVYTREGGGGRWTKLDVPGSWTVSYGSLRFKIRPMGFKHTGLFPEQAVNWDWFSELIRSAGRFAPRRDCCPPTTSRRWWMRKITSLPLLRRR